MNYCRKMLAAVCSLVLLTGTVEILPIETPISISVSAETKLSAPKSLSASFAKSRKSATITWNEVKGAEAYKVSTLNTKTNKYEYVDTVFGNNCVISGLSPETKFYVKVTPLNETSDGYEEGTSAVESFIMPKYTDSIKKISKKTSNKSVKLEWQAASDADFYEIGYEVNGKYKKVKTTSKLTAEITGLKPGTSYKFTVYSGIKANGKNIKGKAYSFTIKTHLKEWTVSEIDNVEWLSYAYSYEHDLSDYYCTSKIWDMDSMSAYDYKAQKLYYFSDVNMTDLYVYNVKTQKRSSISMDSIRKKMFGEPSPSNSLIQNKIKDYQLYGLVYNDYTNEIYVYGGTQSGRKLYIYNLSKKTIKTINAQLFDYSNTSAKTIVHFNNKVVLHGLQFIDKDLLFFSARYYTDRYNVIYDIKKERITNTEFVKFNDSQIFYTNNKFYKILTSMYKKELYSTTNIYDPDFKLEADLNQNSNHTEIQTEYFNFGFDFHNGTLYFKDEYNDFYKINVKKLTKDLWISADDIENTGRNFLSEGYCGAIKVLDNDHVLVHDDSDGKLKMISRIS